MAAKWTQPCILLFYKHLCGSWAVCSVAPHWLKLSMSQWSQASALSPLLFQPAAAALTFVINFHHFKRWALRCGMLNHCHFLGKCCCCLALVVFWPESAVTRSPASPVSWLLLDETKHLLLLSPTFRTFCLVVFACDVTSENPAWQLKALNEGCDASTSASPFLSLSAVLSQPSTPYLLVPHLMRPLSFCVHV